MKIWLKQKARTRMKYEWIWKTIQKKSNPKNQKTVKIKVKLPAGNKNPARKKNLVQTKN